MDREGTGGGQGGDPPKEGPPPPQNPYLYPAFSSECFRRITHRSMDKRCNFRLVEGAEYSSQDQTRVRMQRKCLSTSLVTE
jgi:hypothetical protein